MHSVILNVMKKRMHQKSILLAALCAFLPIHPLAAEPAIAKPVEKVALKAPTKPLAERVGGADSVFVGKLVNRVEDGDWVRAELLVEESLRDVQKGEKIPVIWRKMVGDVPIYDAAEGAKGIAILDDKHEGRYWLRSDKFEPLDQLDLVKELIAKDK